eukprot:Opistho-2@24993
MYKLDLPIDYAERAAIERRRSLEAERKRRIFDARTRTIGVDVHGLNEQLYDKRNVEQIDAERDYAITNEILRNDRVAQLMEVRHQKEVRRLNEAIDDFRLMQQTKDRRREWDLNDPDAKRKDKPARVDDADERCGVSSIQKFTGEDLRHDERAKVQQSQFRDWIEQQIEERTNYKKEMDALQRQYELHQADIDARRAEMEHTESELRRTLATMTRDYNLALADEKRLKDAEARIATLADNETELKNNITGDFLTENPDVAISSFGPHRVVVDRYKGMSPKDKRDILDTQEMQRRDKQARRAAEAAEKRQWDIMLEAQHREALKMERRMDRARKQHATELLEQNKSLAQEQKEKINFIEKVVYTNPPSEDFFAQFNTSSR